MAGTALLLSGGIDSTAIAFWQRPELAIFIDYGQRAAIAEKEAASAVASSLGITFEPITIDASALGTGNMVGAQQIEAAKSPEWWPYRNQFLITVAAMKMISASKQNLLIGTVASDRLHGDGSELFVTAINAVLQAQEGHIKVIAPAINFSAVQLVQRSAVPETIIAWTHSCHTSNHPCGNCRGCDKRNEVLRELGYLT